MAENAQVLLIGAGPGDPGLITVKALDALRRADIIVYDYLANRAFLSHANPDATTIFVGKKGFTDHVTQEEINELLVRLAQENPEACIARLKGGDPFVFGRGGEEALALAENEIDFEVIPGVTSGVAAPAYAGIPVTHRHLASSVAFVTGHEDPTKTASSINWEHLAQGVDTLCFYMGVRNISLIADQLMAHGRSPQEPVALVRWGTTPQQEVLASTLAEVAAEVERVGFQAPAIIVVGAVAKLREMLAWKEKLPLSGKRIVVTRSRTQASRLVEELTSLGAEVIEYPTIAIEPSDNTSELISALEKLSEYSWLVLTSTNGVEYVFDTLLEIGKDARALAGVKVAAIGSATASELIERGIVPDLIPENYVAESLLEAFVDRGVGPDDHILIARAEQARNVLPEGLAACGAQVDVVFAYKTVVDKTAPTTLLLEDLRAGTIDAITFTSSSTVTNFVSLISEALDEGVPELIDLLKNTSLISIGPVTTETLISYGCSEVAQAEVYTIAGLVECLIEHLGGGHLGGDAQN